MYARVLTASLIGLAGEKTWVEVDLEQGLPAFNVVGLVNQSIKESRDRIKSAIANCGFDFPLIRITANLTPANRKKDGSHYDLPIALALLIAQDAAETGEYDDAFADGSIACFGELSLDGKVNKVDGALSMLIELKNSGVSAVIIPKGNLSEAMLVKGMMLYPVETLTEVLEFAAGLKNIASVEADGNTNEYHENSFPDFADIKGQEFAKRAAEVAAAGMHGMLMVGPPGVGKSMIGKRIPGIMPALSFQERLDVTQIYSVAGLISEKNPLLCDRPFRAPHHTISAAALIGGGGNPKPGEISLAHNGVLFLDEFPEFSTHTIDMLRQPLEDGFVSITRVNGKVEYPSRFMLVVAMNPCRCGYYGDSIKPCSCTESDRQKYLGRISGPLLDRIDINICMERIVYKELVEDYDFGNDKTNNKPRVIDSSALRKGVEAAFAMQEARYKGEPINYNSQLTPQLIKKYCALDEESRGLMETAFTKWNLSARQYHRILKVARTIADIDQSEQIKSDHILEALSYRMPEKYFK